MQNFAEKQKCLNLGPNTSYLGIFDQNCFVWVILGNNFKNTIVIFEISTLKFVENVSLSHTVDFGKGSAFSEGPGLGLDVLLYTAALRTEN